MEDLTPTTRDLGCNHSRIPLKLGASIDISRVADTTSHCLSPNQGFESLLISLQQGQGDMFYFTNSSATGESYAIQALNVSANMVGDLTLVYRLWIVAGNSKRKGWIVVPFATSILGAGTSSLVIIQSICADFFGALGFFGIWESSLYISNVNLRASVSFLSKIFPFSSYLYLIAYTNLGVFLPLCTNAIATASLSYHIWKETRYEFGPSAQNRGRLRLVAMGLIETGLIYFAVQLGNSVVISMQWYENAVDIDGASIDIDGATQWLGALNSMIPVGWHICVSHLVVMTC